MTRIGSRLGSQWESWGATALLELTIPPRGHYVYVAWGADPRPLYIGKSRNFFGRMGQHSRVEPWYEETIRFELYAFDSEVAATAAEIEAIQALDPIWNRMRWLTPAQRAAAAAEKKTKRQAYYAGLEAARRKREAKPTKPKREPRVVPVRAIEDRPQSPWQGRRRRRKGADVFDIASPEQLEIIRRVQNRGAA